MRMYLGKASRKVWNFPHFTGVDGFEKKSFSIKNHGLKCLKLPKYSFKSYLNILRIFNSENTVFTKSAQKRYSFRKKIPEEYTHVGPH